MGKAEWMKKIMIIVIGSIIAAYGITLALYAGFGGATLAVGGRVRNLYDCDNHNIRTCHSIYNIANKKSA